MRARCSGRRPACSLELSLRVGIPPAPTVPLAAAAHLPLAADWNFPGEHLWRAAQSSSHVAPEQCPHRWARAGCLHRPPPSHQAHARTHAAAESAAGPVGAAGRASLLQARCLPPLACFVAPPPCPAGPLPATMTFNTSYEVMGLGLGGNNFSGAPSPATCCRRTGGSLGSPPPPRPPRPRPTLPSNVPFLQVQCPPGPTCRARR